MKSRILYAAKVMTEAERAALMSEVAERVNLRQVVKCAPGIARGSRNPNRGGVVSSSVLTPEMRTAFVSSR